MSLFRLPTKKQRERFGKLNFKVPLSPDLSERITFDVIELILFFLSTDKRSLAVCGLVCRDWLATSRNFLHVCVRPKVANGFFHMLQDAPPGITTLAQHVRHVSVEQDFGFDLPPTLLQRARKHEKWESSHFVYGVNDVLAQLVTFSHITKLSLHENPKRPVKEVPHIGEFPHLKELELHSVMFASFAACVSTVCAPPHLQRLSLNSVGWLETSASELQSSGGSEAPSVLKDSSSAVLQNAILPPHLRCLEVYTQQRGIFFEWILNTQGIEGIKSLKLGYSHPTNVDDSAIVNRFLRELGPVLKHLQIHTAKTDRQVNVSHNTCLETLHVVHVQGVDPHHRRKSASEHGLSSILSQLTSPSVTSIVVELFIWDAQILRSLDWKEIGNILASPAFSNLKSAEFQVPTGKEEIEVWLVRKLPNLAQRGILSIEQGELSNIRAMLS